MGKRQKRRKRKRAQERAEEARQEHLGDITEESDYDDDEEEEEEEESNGSGFGFGFFQNNKKESADEPVYDDKPWWAKEEDYELSDYERKQYGNYEKMPPPLKPEHLREPEPARKKANEAQGESPIGQVATVATVEVGKVVERVKKIDWELFQVRISEIQDKVSGGFKRIVEEIQFRNLEMREKVPAKFHIPIYVGIALVLIGIPLIIVVLMFAGRGGAENNNNAIQATFAPTQTLVVEVALPTSAPIVQPTNTRPPATAIPTNTPLPQPTNTQPPPPTSAPVVAVEGSIPVFFAPMVQAWSSDIVRWGQAYNIAPEFLAVVMQLETCGNPAFLGTDGRAGLFAVPADRFQDGETFANPEDNARRAAELITQCNVLTNNDPGQAYACYRSNTDTTQVDFGQWSQSMQAYFLWGFGMYSDTQTGVDNSAALNDWLVNGGGFPVCNEAQAVLDSR